MADLYGYNRSGVQAFRRSGVQAFRRSGVQAFRRSGVQAITASKNFISFLNLYFYFLTFRYITLKEKYFINYAAASSVAGESEAA